MSINVQCPQCNSGWNVTEAFPGSMVHCANCGCAILLAITPTYTSQRFLTPAPQVTGPSQQEVLKAQAVGHLEAWLDVSAEQIQQAL